MVGVGIVVVVAVVGVMFVAVVDEPNSQNY